MIGLCILVLTGLALFGYPWLLQRLRALPTTDSAPRISAAFTALMVLGIAASIVGRPYIGDHVRISLGLLLGVLLATSWLIHVRVASHMAIFFLPVQFCIGAVIESVCRHSSHFDGEFPFLQLGLFLGAVTCAERGSSPRGELPRARIES
jgi:hypothetical protein